MAPKNKCYKSESLGLLRRLRKFSPKPKIIYADPPYSSAQYSRYYHVLDTLVKYDYPPVVGVGRYPPNRFQTSFSLRRDVNTAMNRLVSRTAMLGADLVLSYPANGLFIQVGGDMQYLLKKHYNDVVKMEPSLQGHSSFGSPSADPKVFVEEDIFVARRPNLEIE